MSSCFPWLERAGGEGGWDAGPGPGRQFFFLSLSFPLVQASSLLRGKATVCSKEGAGWSGGCPPGARPAREPSWVLSRVLTWDSRACPARFLRAGCGGLSTPPHLAPFSPGRNGETEADGPCLEDQRPLNFCPLTFVHVGVLEAPKSWLLNPYLLSKERI